MKNNIVILAAMALIFSSCYKEEVVIKERPEGWTYLTHSDQVPANYATVFPQDQVTKMYISIDQDDWGTMQDDLDDLYGSSGGGPGGGPGGGTTFSDEKPVTVKCQVYHNNIQWYDVGIRYKGNSSLQTAYQQGKGKKPLRMDFDYFEDQNSLIDNQRFYGFKELSLGSNINDNSFMHEKVATDMFRSFGVPAPLVSFYEIYIDNGDGNGFVYYGLYTMMEVVFDTMLEDRFGSDTGNCYKPDGDGATFSANYSFNTDELEKKTNEDMADWSDLQSLYNIINSSTRTSNTEQWKTDLEGVFDVDGYLKYLAANTTMQNWDTYGTMTHNFYLYTDPTDGLIKWIPWDNNEALSNDKNNALDFDFITLDEEKWPLIGYIYDIPEYKTAYDNYIDDFIAGPFNATNVNALYQNYYDLIYTSVQNESGIYTYLNSFSDFTTALSTQQAHSTNRNSAAANYTP
jgi:hypothetical protein